MKPLILKAIWLVATIALIVALVIVILSYLGLGMAYFSVLALIPGIGGISIELFDHFLKPRLQSHKSS